MTDEPDDSSADRFQARVRLALRAERAFGLASVRVWPNPEAHAPDGPLPRPPGAEATEATRAEPSAAASDLFGSPDVLESAMLGAPVPLGQLRAPELSSEEKRKRLQELDENEVRGCTRCRLCEARTH